MKKMIVLDLDGTLLNSNGKVTDESKEYLNKLKKDGYIIVIATGRILNSAIINTDGASFANYIISDTGALITNKDNLNNIYKKTISSSYVNLIIDFLEKYMEHIDYIDICDNNYYNKYTEERHTNSKVVKLIDNLEEFLSNLKEAIHIGINFKNQEVVQVIYKELKKEFSNLDFNLMQDSFSSIQTIEIIHKGISKYSSIEILAQLENISNNNIIAFGDGLNDIEMLQKCGIGVAMDNALDEVKKEANFITKSHNEDGIIDFLEKYLQS